MLNKTDMATIVLVGPLAAIFVVLISVMLFPIILTIWIFERIRSVWRVIEEKHESIIRDYGYSSFHTPCREKVPILVRIKTFLF